MSYTANYKKGRKAQFLTLYICLNQTQLELNEYVYEYEHEYAYELWLWM